ncbi:MAG TPA: glycoside hydrolase family 3 protein, partial [bacterium]|nr:glycoside hydrolase family 3 protein [bacterium]
MIVDKKKPPYLDTSLSFEKRADNLISLMTVEEKLSQLLHKSAAVERLKIPAYDWWNECLHGVARAGKATVFPQAIGLAASFSEKLFKEIGTAISDEARAKHHDALRRGKRERYYGLTFWTPNINIYRDPRWGRGQETYGECPYLTSRLAVTFIKAMQGDAKKYLKTAACAKHFAVHSGPDSERHTFDAVVSESDFRGTYLPAFEACVKEARVESVMGAYNRVYGEPACASKKLLDDILRKEWGFKGHVVSDCAAIQDIYLHHKTERGAEEASAAALKAGCDLNCCLEDCQTPGLAMKRAFAKGLISEADIDRALKRLLMTRLKLGMFDPPEKVKYSRIPMSVVCSDKHRKLALKAARESMVLLKNDGILPLERKKLRSIAVIGANADDVEALLGNYSGEPDAPVKILDGIKKAAGKNIKVSYTPGYLSVNGESRDGFEAALNAASAADMCVAVMGMTPKVEGEECDVADERVSLNLPGVQEELLVELARLNKPIVLVLTGGGCQAFGRAEKGISAVIQAWYPGESGGTAVADVIFGNYNPSGRLPITFYR